MIIVSVTGPSMADAVAQMKASRRYADMFETRLDLIRHPDIVGLLTAAGRPVMATCRTAGQGGKFRGSSVDRLTMLRLASALGAAYVDLEYPNDGGEAERWGKGGGEAKLILSHHASKAPARSLVASMHGAAPDVLKLAYRCTDAHEISHAIGYTSRLGKKQGVVAIATGAAGEASRVLYRKFGGWGTFAAAETGDSAAEGQLPASVMRKLFRADAIDSKTQVFGVIGSPLAQSRGIHLHNPLFRRAGLNAVYCRFPVKDLKEFMKHLAPLMEGFSVTVPHKEAIIPFLDDVEPSARKIGAVNTVYRTGKSLIGTNTDGTGALDAIEETGPVRGQRVLVLGAGGAARAIIAESVARGADVMVANRTAARARKLAREFGIEAVERKQIGRTEFDLFVNATTVGMVPDQGSTPLPASLLKGKKVFDVVFNPPVTKLMDEAQKKGSPVIAGTEMYIRQAMGQSFLYTGRKPSLRAMRKLLGYDA